MSLSPEAKSAVSSSSSSVYASTSVTAGFPFVRVPVLSSAIFLTLHAVSSASASLTSMPSFAPRPMPTIIAVGVASPNAHGQAITSTDTNARSAIESGSPTISQIAPETMAIAPTMGIKTPLILSASLSIGSFAPCASLTRRIMPESIVSSPTCTAFTVIAELMLRLPPVTLSPSSLSIGILSPVSIDSSTLVAPETIVPSTGMFSPGRTITTSPGRSSSMRTRRSTPFLSITDASSGARFMSALSASPVLPFARASKYLPSITRVIMVPIDSK